MKMGCNAKLFTIDSLFAVCYLLYTLCEKSQQFYELFPRRLYFESNAGMFTIP